MGIQPVHNPYGAPTPYIDKVIGDAYTIVRTVADHLKYIKYLAYNMESIVNASEILKATGNLTKKVVATAGAPGSTTEIALPDGVTVNNLLSSSVMLVAEDGTVHTESSASFRAVIQNGSLRVVLFSSSSANMAGAEIRWYLTYGG